MKNKGLLITVVVLVLVGGAFFTGMLAYLIASGGEGINFGRGRIGVVAVNGTILTSKDTIRHLTSFRRNDDIKSIILRVESPGGSVAASQEILEAVKETASEKPVIVSMGAVAASGGYYVALGAERIFANPATITGSIGVRMEHVMIGDLLKWAKIKHETLKSGKFKNMTPMDKPITPEARAILQNILDEMHEQFKETVATARKLDKAKVDEIADGRIFTGQQALELGLIDELGGMSKVIEYAASKGGIKGEPKLIYPKKRLELFERIATGLARSIVDELAVHWQ
jgi:protease IV